jgi:hypothetical protein
MHRPKFKKHEFSAQMAHPFLAKQDRAGGYQADHQGNQQTHQQNDR